VVAVQNAVPYAQLGVATSTATFFRTIGGAFGVSALGAIFDGRLISNLSKHASAGQLKLISGGSITANPEQIDHLPIAQRVVFIDAFSHALQDVFLVAVPFAILAFVLSWIMKEIPLRTTAQSSTLNGDGDGDGDGEGDVQGDLPAPVGTFAEF
jgi:uncharacterized protein YejL (UPF0352 family)